jgi:hypothetical protein
MKAAILIAFAALTSFSASRPASAQVYLFTNNRGQQVEVDLSKGNPEEALVAAMRRHGGSGWEKTFSLEPGECMVWQSFQMKGQPKRYFRGRYAANDLQGRRRAIASAEAGARAAHPERSSGTFGQTCSKGAAGHRNFDMRALEARASK